MAVIFKRMASIDSSTMFAATVTYPEVGGFT